MPDTVSQNWNREENPLRDVLYVFTKLVACWSSTSVELREESTTKQTQDAWTHLRLPLWFPAIALVPHCRGIMQSTCASSDDAPVMPDTKVDVSLASVLHVLHRCIKKISWYFNCRKSNMDFEATSQCCRTQASLFWCADCMTGLAPILSWLKQCPNAYWTPYMQPWTEETHRMKCAHWNAQANLCSTPCCIVSCWHDIGTIRSKWYARHRGAVPPEDRQALKCACVPKPACSKESQELEDAAEGIRLANMGKNWATWAQVQCAHDAWWSGGWFKQCRAYSLTMQRLTKCMSRALRALWSLIKYSSRSAAQNLGFHHHSPHLTLRSLDPVAQKVPGRLNATQ